MWPQVTVPNLPDVLPVKRFHSNHLEWSPAHGPLIVYPPPDLPYY